jgi:hypothetical protein
LNKFNTFFVQQSLNLFQAVQTGFMGSSQAPMSMQLPTEVSNAGAALSGLDQQSALAAVANTGGSREVLMFSELV